MQQQLGVLELDVVQKAVLLLVRQMQMHVVILVWEDEDHNAQIFVMQQMQVHVVLVL